MEKPIVKLSGQDGNAFNILGIVIKALRDDGYNEIQIGGYIQEAIKGDFDHLLNVTTKWVEVE